MVSLLMFAVFVMYVCGIYVIVRYVWCVDVLLVLSLVLLRCMLFVSLNMLLLALVVVVSVNGAGVDVDVVVRITSGSSVVWYARCCLHWCCRC